MDEVFSPQHLDPWALPPEMDTATAICCPLGQGRMGMTDGLKSKRLTAGTRARDTNQSRQRGLETSQIIFRYK